MPSAHRHPAGLTLIEVLVALLMLSLGALSLAMAGSESMRLGEASLRYSTAVAAANDLIDLHRALPRAYPDSGDSAGFASGPPAMQGFDCTRTACAPEDLRAFIDTSWKCSLGYADHCPHISGLHRLPDFDAELSVDRATGDVRVNLEWRVRGRLQRLEIDGQEA